VNILTTYRTNGWAVEGLPITMNGVIYSHIKKGAYNGDEFIKWLTGLLEIMNPYPAPNSVLILDNCRIHHVEGVEELCVERYV
ncbi:hypothetical protein EDB85DRAFT_1821142, partial [Lactarius pseudohatsudake]